MVRNLLKSGRGDPLAPPRDPDALRRAAAGGVARAFAVLTAWAVTQAVVLWGPWTALGLLPVLVFLYTGLFITAHDAMHGTLAPGRPRLNDTLGRVCVAAYAAFSFDHLRGRHLRHHAAPASADDPDHHRGDVRMHRWYLDFMREYLTWGQMVRMALISVALTGLGVPLPRLLLAWALPSVLSTLQLFYFGIWRPHHEPAVAWPDRLRARSHDLPPWLSFLACYHFGYHREHHALPHLPWWKLPLARGRVPEVVR